MQGSRGWTFGEGKGILGEKEKEKVRCKDNLEDEFLARGKEFFVKKGRTGLGNLGYVEPVT